MEKEKLQTILAHLKSEISGVFKDELDKTILFGSNARGDQNPLSDIDILVVLNRNEGLSSLERKLIRKISDRIFLDFDSVVQIFPIPKHLYKPEESLFFRTVEREGIPI